MTVSELIAVLQKCRPDAPVLMYDMGEGGLCEAEVEKDQSDFDVIIQPRLPAVDEDQLRYLIDDDSVVIESVSGRGTRAKLRHTNGDVEYAVYNNGAWRFLGGGPDPTYQAGYAAACGYHD